MAVVTRASKGSVLTHSEMDTNFEEINLKANSTDMTTALALKANSTDVGVANSSLVKTALNASGSAPIYACRAWVNFNGTDTVAIRASGNVSSITDNGTSQYTVNFTTAMQDTNYAVILCLSEDDTVATTGGVWNGRAANNASTSSIRVQPYASGGSFFDPQFVYVAIFR